VRISADHCRYLPRQRRPSAGRKEICHIRHLRRGFRELLTDVSLRVEDTESPTPSRCAAGESCIYLFN
jgi:hypothetical protein